jgi:hypothetical protein
MHYFSILLFSRVFDALMFSCNHHFPVFTLRIRYKTENERGVDIYGYTFQLSPIYATNLLDFNIIQ